MAENTKIIISAVDKTQRGLGSVTANLKKVAGAVFSVRTALVGVAGAAGFGLLVKSSLNATDSLAKTASKIGTTTEALAGLRYAADLTGVSTQTMDMALQRFTRRAAEAAQGTGEAKDAILELGIDARQLVKVPLDQRMLILADAFDKVENEADKLRLAFKLFDSEGAALVNTLGLGRDGLAEMLGEARALGVVMSSDAAAGVEDANDALTRLRFLFKGVTDQTVAALAPAIETLSNKFKDFLLEVTKSKGGIEAFAQSMAQSILKSVGTVLTALQSMVNGVIGAFNSLITAKNKITGIFTPDDSKNAEQLKSKIAEITEQLQRQEAIANSNIGRRKAAAENSISLLTQEKAALEQLLVVALESGNTNLIPNVTFANDAIAVIDQLTASLQKMGDTGAEAANKIAASGDEAVKKISYQQKIQKEGRASLADFESKTTTEQTQIVLGELATQFSGVSRHNKKLFQLNKAFQIGQAVMNTYAGASKALGSYPPPLNFVMAAAVVASGLAQVAQIRSQSFEGGGFTGHGPRTGGVDGKGGFPAILHPNETVIDHTKGQGKRLGMQGDQIVINQTFNVSTGVAQTVRAEIANLMPQITQVTTGAVIDARQRGSRALGA